MALLSMGFGNAALQHKAAPMQQHKLHSMQKPDGVRFVYLMPMELNKQHMQHKAASTPCEHVQPVRIRFHGRGRLYAKSLGKPAADRTAASS